MSASDVTVLALVESSDDASTVAAALSMSSPSANVMFVGPGSSVLANSEDRASRSDLTNDLLAAVGGVGTEWVALLGVRCTPEPGWLDALTAVDVGQEVSAVGGRVVSVHSGRTLAAWLSAQENAAQVSWYGTIRSRLGDLPEAPFTQSAAFLDGRCLLVRTELLTRLCEVLQGCSVSGLGLVLGRYLVTRGHVCVYTSGAVVVEELPTCFDRTEAARSLGYDGWLAHRVSRGFQSTLARLAFYSIGQKASPGRAVRMIFRRRPGGQEKWLAATEGRASARAHFAELTTDVKSGMRQ